MPLTSNRSEKVGINILDVESAKSFICLCKCSVVMKRHHSHVNSYKRKHVIEACF